MGVSRQRHAPAALYPRERPPVPIVQGAGWAAEPVWKRGYRKILSPLLGIEPRSPSRLVRSQTLYWLCYPAHIWETWPVLNQLLLWSGSLCFLNMLAIKKTMYILPAHLPYKTKYLSSVWDTFLESFLFTHHRSFFVSPITSRLGNILPHPLAGRHIALW
jgi:hypothetical protein